LANTAARPTLNGARPVYVCRVLAAKGTKLNPLRPALAGFRAASPGVRYAVWAAVAVALAVVSLRFPSTPTYDPWSWIIWGREIIHLQLVTTGGPSWKPLPVLFTTLFAPFGEDAPQLWLVVARTGGITALALAFTLAFRLARALPRRTDVEQGVWPTNIGSPGGLVPAVIAGCAAAVGLLILSQYIDYVALGDSEGLLAAATLLAILRHLDGARRQALFWGFVAALDRPETWPFFGLYAIYLCYQDPQARKLTAGLAAAILPLWFVPELLGSGSLVRGVQTAQHPRPESATFARCPFCTELTEHAWQLVATPLKLGALALLGFVAARVLRVAWPARGRRLAALRSQTSRWERVVLGLGVLGLSWFLEEAILTQAGFSGNDRYLIAAAAVIVVLGAVGWAAALSWLGGHLLRFGGRTAGVLAAAALFAPGVLLISRPHIALLSVRPTESSLRYQADLRRDLPKAVDLAGGPAALISCGPIQTNPSEAPLTAWTLGLELASITGSRGDVIIQSRNAVNAPLLPAIPRKPRYRLVAQAGTVSIFVHCGQLLKA
jgi:hypothetical protein